MRSISFKCAVLLSVMTLGFSGATYIAYAPPALAAASPMMTGKVIRDFARITFYWPEQVDFTASTSTNKLTVKFDREANPDVGAVLAALYPYVTKVEVAVNRRTIIFTMKAPYRIRTFVTETESGVDLLDVFDTEDKTKPQQEPVKQDIATSAATEIASAAPTIPVEENDTLKKETAIKKAAEQEKKKELEPEEENTLVAPAGEKEVKDPPVLTTPKPVPPVKEKMPSHVTITPVGKGTKAPVVEVKAAEANVPEGAKAAPPLEKQPVKTEETTIHAAAPSTHQETEKPQQEAAPAPYEALRKDLPIRINGEALNVGFLRVNGEPHITFPWETRVASAMWRRDNALWILFSKPAKLQQLKAIEAQAATWIEEVKQIGGVEYSLLRIKLRRDAYAIAQKSKQGNGWEIALSDMQPPMQSVLQPEIRRSGEKEVFIPAPQTEGVFSVRDPEIGDLLQVVALYPQETALGSNYSFVDFSLSKTDQGLVIKPVSDALQITRKPDGVHITMPDGLHLSPVLPKPEIKRTPAEIEAEKHAALYKPTLLPYDKWKANSPDDFHEKETHYLQEILASPDKKERSPWREKLAGLYFSDGRINETLAVLSRLRMDDLDYFRAHKLAALEGMSHFLSYRLPESALSLTSDVLDNLEEATLLRRAVNVALDPQSPEPIPYLEMNDSYIRQYPPELRQRLAIIATNQMLDQQKTTLAIQILNSLKADGIDKPIANYVEYLQAKAMSIDGNRAGAKAIWQKMATNLEDRQFRARALYSLTLDGLKDNTLKVPDAINQLGKVQLLWRGDDLERAAQLLLGQLQVNSGNYWDGLKSWQSVLDNFPNSPDAMEAYKRMAQTFRSLFMDNGVKDMQPVKALALYNEFKDLTPVGAEGNKVIQNLVDKLVAVDLLDQATEQLNHQIKYKTQGQEKSVLGARLALVALLNEKPTEALMALQETRVDGVPASLSLNRNRLAAEALLQLDRPAQGLTMIDGDYSPEAENIRIDAYDKQRDWANLVDAIELQFNSRPNKKAAFTNAEAQRLLQLTMGYIFLGEYDEMRYLREAYAPLMEKSIYKDEFMFLAQDRVPVDYENFKVTTDSISSTKQFMESYRKKIAQSSLSDAMSAPPASEPAGKAGIEKAIPSEPKK